MFTWFRNRRRRQLLAAPFPDAWADVLHRNVAHHPLLGDEERARLRDIARVLVAEKCWEGCGGLVVTDEMKVTVAAQAALLLLHREHDYFGRVISILLYPSAFAIPREEPIEAEPSIVEDGPDEADDQAHYRGPVILAWDAVLEESRDVGFGANIVLHEFAHQLDFLDGSSNGVPDLDAGEAAERWDRVIRKELRRLQKAVKRGRDTFLGEDAADDAAELFAVATERFFTQPAELRRRHEDLFGLLVQYYGTDPTRWFAGGD